MPVLCLVPTAQRAARAARRLCDAQDGVLLGARVVTPDAAAALVLAGRDPRPVLSPLAERLLVSEAALAVPLFDGAAESSGTLRALCGCIAELRRAEVRAEHLRGAARALPGPGARRVEAVAEVLAAYEERLASLELLDAASALRAAADRVDGRGERLDALGDLDLLVVDGFVTLAPPALDLAVALTRRARRAQWRVPYFPSRSDLSAAAEPLVRRIEALHHVGGHQVDLVLDDVDEPGRAPRLTEALRAILGAASTGQVTGAEGRLVVAAGTGEEGEAELAAGLLSRLVDGGFAPEEVLLLAATPDAAERTCRAAESLHLPLSGRPRARLADLPPVGAVLSALDAAARPRRSALEVALSSPYLSLAHVPGRMALWLDRAGASDDRGDPSTLVRRRAAALSSPRAAPERAALRRVADALDAAGGELARIGSPATAREHAARLRGFVARTGVRRHAARGAPDLARRDLQAVSRLEEVADDLVRALAILGRGAEVLAAARWAALLSTAAGQVTMQAGAEAALGIEVAPVADAPGLAARAAVVVGCGRGSFPAAVARDPLLGDPERMAVNALLGRAALATSGARAAEARHAALAALAAPREALCVTWPGPGPEGAGRGPAPVATELASFADASGLAALPDPRRSVAAAVRSLAATRRGGAAPPSNGRSALARRGDEPVPGARPEAQGPPEVLGEALGQRVASVLARVGVEQERQAAVAARRASRFSGAIPAERRTAYAELLPDAWTPSQLEEHATCPFRFFVGTVLSATVPPGVEPDIDPRDEGSLAHAVLERFYRDRIATGRGRLLGAPDERAELAVAARAVFAAFEADGRTGDAVVWATRRGVVLQRLERVIAEEADRGGDAVPALVEHRFGGEGGAPPLVFTDGELEVRLRGRLDRVDVAPDRIVLVDYKDSQAAARWRDKLRREALGTVNFQVPAYLMAAARAVPGRARLEATYLLLRSAERLAPLELRTEDPILATDEEARARGRAAGDRPFADAVLQAVRAIRSGALPIASRDCTGCAFGAVCRFEARAEDDA